MIPQPIIYEVATPINILKDATENYTQTNIDQEQFKYLTKQLEIFELPVEMDVKKDTSSTCIQTDIELYRTEDGYFIADFANKGVRKLLSQQSEVIQH